MPTYLEAPARAPKAMSALGQKQRFAAHHRMSALPSKVDTHERGWNIDYGPEMNFMAVSQHH